MEGLFGVRTVRDKLEHNDELVLTNKDAAVPSSTTCAKSEGRKCSPSGTSSFSQTGAELTCVAMSAFATKHQKKDAIAPA